MLFPLALLALWLPFVAIRRIVRRVRADRAMRRLMIAAAGAAAEHAATLVGKERQTVYEDEYGAYVFDAFNREIDRFVHSVVLRNARPGDHTWASRRYDVKDQLKTIVQRCVYEIHLPAQVEKEADAPLAIPENHKAFEHWCAQALGEQGWEARVIGGSDDQGADILATKKGSILVVQCKRWAAPVGNSAVQEVAAARAHNGAHQALVVSPSGFTAAARQLAATNDVMLVDAVELVSGAGFAN